MELDGTYTNFHEDGACGVPQECLDHADGGCSEEPICPECRSACQKYEGEEPPLTAPQKEALRALAEAYGNLSYVWGDAWEGPDRFGGVLEDLGVLPRLQLEEAEAELMSLITDDDAVTCKDNDEEGNCDDEE
jgi:hypothetical protein